MEENNLLRVELKELLTGLTIDWTQLGTNLIEATIPRQDYTAELQLELLVKGWTTVDTQPQGRRRNSTQRKNDEILIYLKQNEGYLHGKAWTKHS